MKNHPTVKWYHENYDIQPGKMDRTELNYEQVKEFIQGFERSNAVSRKLTTVLQTLNINSLHPSAGFPMDVSKWPGKMWTIPHKIVAVAAGMGHLGHNRLIIHPDFGNFIVLGSLLIDRSVTKYDAPLDYNPCIKCGLCVSVCPVGQPDISIIADSKTPLGFLSKEKNLIRALLSRKIKGSPLLMKNFAKCFSL